MKPQNVLLVKVPARLDAVQADAVRAGLAAGSALSVTVFAALEIDESYVYCVPQVEDGEALLSDAQGRVAAVCPAGSQTCLLMGMVRMEGASQGASAPWHYIVETDVTPEFEREFNNWYNQEHMPGLAAVPGTVRADRYQCLEESPRYYACYDLHTLETFGSPPWMAVRATEWSSRVRPAFRNTKRTMFARV
jgi:hypothetical protein